MKQVSERDVSERDRAIIDAWRDVVSLRQLQRDIASMNGGAEVRAALGRAKDRLDVALRGQKAVDYGRAMYPLASEEETSRGDREP